MSMCLKKNFENECQAAHLEVIVVNFKNVASGRFAETSTEAHASLDHNNLPGLHIDAAELRDQVQSTLLRHNQPVAVSIVEGTIRHRFVGGVHVDGDAVSRTWIAGATESVQSLNKIATFPVSGKSQWMPPHLVWIWRSLGEIRFKVLKVDITETGIILHSDQK